MSILRKYLSMNDFNSLISILIAFFEIFYGSLNKKPKCLNHKQTLLPLEHVEDMTPLATEEALPSIPEEQSPILVIEGVLDDLSLEVETTEVQRGREGGGVELHAWKRNNKGGDADDEDQTKHSSEEHIEQQVIIQTEEQVLIRIEESIPKRDHKEKSSRRKNPFFYKSPTNV